MHKSVSWHRDLAYAVGLITTDGCLSKDKRHLDLTSKDISLLKDFSSILNLTNKITRKRSTYNPSGIYFHIQFSHVALYRFLTHIGLTPNKSKTIGILKIPKEYFADFLRGHLDGDGNFFLAKHPESQYPQLRLKFTSASFKHLKWIKACILEYFNISGGSFYRQIPKSVSTLTYAKSDSLILLDLIYYHGVKYYLHRKFVIISDLLGEWRNWHTRTI